MKQLITLIGLLLFLICCGEDGKEGQAYISFDWDFTVTYYDDSNPSIPSTIWRGQDYESETGSFYFDYGVDDGNEARLWTGSYTISKNPGEEGSLFVDGDDGTDKFYEIYLGFNGPRVSVHKLLFQNNDKNSKDSLTNKKSIIGGRTPPESKKLIINDGHFTIELSFKRVD